MPCGSAHSALDLRRERRKIVCNHITDVMPEKSLNEISRDARVLYQKAAEAAQRENFDYALALFCQVLEKDPAFLECRKQLRAAQLQKAGTGGTGFFKKMLSGAGSSPQLAKAQIALRRDPAEALAVAEQILNSDPHSGAAQRIIVQAAQALELPLTAMFALEQLVKASPKDKAVAIEYANALSAGGGDSSHGERVLQELMRANPNDGDLNQALKNLSARKTLDEGGYGALEDGTGSYRDILKNKDEAVSLEREQKVQRTEDNTARLTEEYEDRLRTEPGNLKVARTLAELYAQKNNYAGALNLYEQIRHATPDPTIDRAIADTTAKQFEFQISQLNPFAPDHAEQVEKIQAQKNAFQLVECQKRADKYPTDLVIRFELGSLLFQNGKLAEAIGELQKAQNNPSKRIQAMNLLAQCFAKRKMYDMAGRKLQEALKEKPAFDEEKKDLIYQYGCVLEAMGKREEAIEQFKQIYEADISYRDVAAKVDAFYSGQ